MEKRLLIRGKSKILIIEFARALVLGYMSNHPKASRYNGREETE